MSDALYCDPQLARFYDWDNPWSADFDFFAGLVSGSRRVLDLGCGTGIFSVALAGRGHQVTGVDPAAAMLDIARCRPDGDKVRWVQADARSVDLAERFDMVLMTGHAFQTLLSRSDRTALIGTMAGHLEPGGRFFFDSRNPIARAWEQWVPAVTRQTRRHPDFGDIVSWNDAEYDRDNGVVTYDTNYRLESGRTFSARSQIAFPPQAEIAGLIAEAGLSVDRWIGDCAGGEFLPDSPEIIPLGSRSSV